MKRTIARNLAIVSAVFVATLSIMLVTNYFQVRSATPLQTGVIEMLKGINDQNAGNPELQEQIRQLDLLARKAYFVRHDHLMAGVYLLLGMLAILVVSLRIYYAGEKNIPDKNPDTVDEWDVKTRARRYIVWGVSGLAAVAVAFALFSLPSLGPAGTAGEETATIEAASPVEGQPAIEADAGSFDGSGAEPEGENIAATDATVPATATDDTAAETTAGSDPAQPSAQSATTAPVSKVTHNGFRGNNSSGVSAAKGIPVSWDLSDGTNILWRQDIPRQGFNSPVINGDKVFFSGADGSVRELYCLSLSTGEKLWSLSATGIPGSPSAAPQTSADTGLAASTVATNGRQVCAVFATGDVIAADMNGNRLWAKNLGVPDNHYGYASSPVMYGNYLIIQWDNTTDAKVVALDAGSGNVVWSKPRTADKVAWSSPLITRVGGSPQLILMGTPAITAYNPDNGEQLWRVEGLTGEVGASAGSSDGVIFAASEYAKLVAVAAADGTTLWESTDYLPEVSSPVVAGKNLIVATSYGVVVSYDKATGKLKKEHELGEEFYSSPVVADGRVYLVSNSGKVFVFSAGDDFSLLQQFETGEATYATPAFTDGKIVVRTQNSIYCVSES